MTKITRQEFIKGLKKNSVWENIEKGNLQILPCYNCDYKDCKGWRLGII
jgi:hypothetical protein